MTQTKKPYRRSQLLLPLMRSLESQGGASRPSALYDDIAARLGLTQKEREASTKDRHGSSHNIFERDIRWMRQTAVKKSLMASHRHGSWSLTDLGGDRLQNAQPGILLTVFETPQGTALWGALDSAIGGIEDGSIDLLFTSPPYPNAHKSYENGSLSEDDWVAFMMDMISGYRPKMAQSGSMMLNIAETYAPGIPIKMEHISKLRVRLATETRFRVLDTLIWNNPSRLPSPFNWVAKRRIRLKSAAETVLWISENPMAKADNSKILTPYKRTPENVARENLMRLQKGFSSDEEIRPSGHAISRKGFERNNGGAIPGNVFSIGATNSSKAFRNYAAACRNEGIPEHPAIMPLALAERCIKLTTDPGDLVVDPMGGSFTTARAAENLGRQWISSDIALAYIAGARHRFDTRHDNAVLIDSYLNHIQP